jgi:ComEC/Rec2-related protein
MARMTDRRLNIAKRIPRFPEAGIRLEWLVCGGVVAGAGACRAVAGDPALLSGTVIAAAAGLVALLLLFRWQVAAAFALALALAAGVIGGLCARTLPADHYGRVLDGRSRAGEMIAAVTDTGLSPLAGLPPPSLIQAKALAIKLNGEAGFRPVSGTLFLRLPRETSACPAYGDRLRISGMFQVPEDDIVYLAPDGALIDAPGGGGDFADYLAARQVAAIAAVKTVATIGRDPGWMGFMLHIRDALLERAVAHIQLPRYQAEAAGIFFGCRGGLDPVTRRDLVRSGAIHIFSVSGLHVAVLAALIFWLLRPLSFRLRYLVTPIPVLLYVLTTGANVPALRAFWMIAIWCAMRSMLLKTPPFNVLCLVAAVMVGWNPDNLGDIGFLYSFVITGVLLILADNWHRAGRLFRDPAQLMPESALKRRRQRIGHLKFKIALALSGCLAAFLGGSAISLYFQGLFLPGSILANLAALPLVGALFQVMALKLLLGWIGPLDVLLAWLAECLFSLLDLVVTAASACFGSTAGRPPAWWELAIFYAALLALIFPGKSLARRAAAAVILFGAIGFWHFTPGVSDRSVLIAAGGRLEFPMVVIADRAAGVGVAVNVPDGGATLAASRFLKSHGIHRLDRVGFSHPRVGAAKGLSTLLREMPVDVVELPPKDAYSRDFFAALDEFDAAVFGFHFAAPGESLVRIVQEKSRLRIEYCNRGSTFIGMIDFNFAEPSPYYEVTVGNRHYRRTLAGSSLTEITVYEF